MIDTFNFVTEDGRKTLKYEDYLKDADLMAKIADGTRLLLNLGKTIISYDRDWLESHPQEKAQVEALNDMLIENPLSFFSPSTITTNQGLDFLNDTTTDVKLLICGNRRGKTSTSVIDVLLSIVPTSEEWPIFKLHGVKRRPWNGPCPVGFATSDWKIMQRVLWNEIRKWIPKYELGEYDPRQKGYKDIAWQVRPEIKLKCGSELFFFVYEQKQSSFEGQALKIWYWDEQGEESKWDGADERTRTLRGRHVHGLTPIKLEGRADTGARGWMNEMVNGRKLKGHTVKNYAIGPDDVPDWVYPETEKKKAYEKHILAPKRLGDLKALAEGESRYYGKWHETGGLVYDEFRRATHVLFPFKIPSNWTRYRGLDHGVNNPTACLCAAVSPEKNIFLYAEYYRSGLGVYENVANIVSMCGNTIKNMQETEVGGIVLRRKEEFQNSQRFRFTVMDRRSRNSPDAMFGVTLGRLYEYAGLRTVDASGQENDVAVPIVKRLLSIDPERIHPITKQKGSPQLFFFSNLEFCIREIEGYAMQDYSSGRTEARQNRKEKPITKDDHLMSALKYLAQLPMIYVNDVWAYDGTSKEDREDADEETPKPKTRTRDPFTGY